MKTNAVRLLDAAKIPYELREYEVDPEDLSAETVATIVAKTDGVPLFVEELAKSVMESAGEDSSRGRRSSRRVRPCDRGLPESGRR